MESHQSPKNFLSFYYCRIFCRAQSAERFRVQANAGKTARFYRQNFHEARVFRENKVKANALTQKFVLAKRILRAELWNLTNPQRIL